MQPATKVFGVPFSEVTTGARAAATLTSLDAAIAHPERASESSPESSLLFSGAAATFTMA